MTCRTLPLLLAIGLALVAGPAPAAQAPQGAPAGGSVAVELRSPADLVVNPGQAFTLVFRVTNLSARAINVETEPIVPDGWTVLLASRRLTLAAGASDLEFVNVFPLRTVPAGIHGVGYSAWASTDAQPVLSFWSMTVREIRDLAVAVEEAPPVLAIGQKTVATFVITNLGNAPRDVRLSARGSQGQALQADWTSATLGAGESRVVTLAIEASGLQGVARRETVRLKVQDSDGTTAAESSASVEMVPLGVERRAAATRLPASVTMTAGTGQPARFGSFEASGALNESETAHLELLARTKSTSNLLWGDTDAYYFHLKASRYDVAAGDGIWQLSPLTEVGRYGFGGSSTVRAGFLTAGAFVDDGPRQHRGPRQVGGTFGLRFSDRTQFTVQYLERSRGERAEIWTVRARFPLAPRTSVDFESGVGESAGMRGRAGALAITGLYPRLNFTARKVQADEHYPIRERAALDDSATVSWRLWKQLHVDGTYNVLMMPLPLDLPAFIPNRQRAGGAGISLGSWIRVEARRQEWARDAESWAGGWLRETAVGRLSIPLGRLRIGPKLTLGHVSRPGDPALTPFRVTSLESSLRLGDVSTVAVSVEELRGEPGDAGLRRYSGTVSAQLRLTARTDLSGSVNTASNDTEPWFQGARIADLTIEQRLWFDHAIVVTARGQWGGIGQIPNRTLFRADYRVPIGLPYLVRQSHRGHTVVGQFVSHETGAPLARMVVRLDSEHVVLTDKNGLAHFNGVAPGTYYPTADLTSVGRDLATVPTMPIPVTVTSGETARFRVTVVRTGSIRGVVGLGKGGLAGVSVEAAKDGQIFRRVSNPAGVFEFRNLPPGNWEVRVTDIAVPAFHQLVNDRQMVAVQSGAQAAVSFTVAPKERVIVPVPPR